MRLDFLFWKLHVHIGFCRVPAGAACGMAAGDRDLVYVDGWMDRADRCC